MAAEKIGLALSGGGALGTYQVGVIKAYVELGGRIDVLAGSSTGAFNGAVLLSAPSLAEGVKRLERIWLEEIPTLPLKELIMLRTLFRILGNTDIYDILVQHQELLGNLLNTCFDSERIAIGPPFYVSLYKSQNEIPDFIRWFIAKIGLSDTPPSEFFHLQSFDTNRQREIILASVAFPLCFPPRVINGKRYADGSLGGVRKNQGNTPVDPLVDAGCDIALVSHLSDGSLWSRDEYPNLTIVEFRPQDTLERGLVKDSFEQDPNVLRSWIGRGYKDARRRLERILEVVASRHDLHRSEEAIANAETATREAENRQKKAMALLRKP